MLNKIKIYIFISATILLLLAGIIGEHYYYTNKINKLTNQINIIQDKANLAEGKAETLIVEKNTLKKEFDKEKTQLNELLKTRENDIIGLINVSARSSSGGKGALVTKPPATLPPFNCPIIDTEFEFKDYRLQAQGNVLTKEFTYQLKQTFKLRFIETKIKNQHPQMYGEVTELDSNGKSVTKWEFDKFEYKIIDETKNSFYWWAPHLTINIDLGFNAEPRMEAGFSLGFNFLAYGKTINDNLFRALEIGFGYDGHTGYALIRPFLYNIGDPLPLITDLWLSPFIGIDLNGHYILGLSIGKTL